VWRRRERTRHTTSFAVGNIDAKLGIRSRRELAGNAALTGVA
jgi:hypothetical protein